MKAIKILVLSMAAVLVVGFGFLIWGLSGGARVSPSASAKHSVVAGPAEFGDIRIDLPVGGKIDQVLAVGDKVVVRVVGAGADRLMVLDPVTGKSSGSFVLEPGH